MRKIKNLKSAKKISVITVDIKDSEIFLGRHHCTKGEDIRKTLSLRMPGTTTHLKMRSRFKKLDNNPIDELRANLAYMLDRGVLHKTIFVLGLTEDPLHPFGKNFDLTMRCAELFKQYVPKLLHIQTRSPLVVIMMPLLRELGSKCMVTMPVETHNEEVAERFTPDLPRVGERLKAANALRNLGVTVTLSASPILPYGDWREDAKGFANTLDENSDFIIIDSLCSGRGIPESIARKSKLAMKLANAKLFHWLRPDTIAPVCAELSNIAPFKFEVPDVLKVKDRQPTILKPFKSKGILSA